MLEYKHGSLGVLASNVKVYGT